MTKESMNVLLWIEDHIHNMIDNPDRIEMISQSYEAVVDAIRFECSEMTDCNEEYIEKTFICDQFKILRDICWLVKELDKWNEEPEADHV